MGWLWLALIGAGAMGAMALLGVPRLLWSFVGSALMLGAAGYALQGRPTLGGGEVTASAKAIADDPGLIELRDRMFGGRFYADSAYLTAADAMTRVGDPRAAVQVMLGGVRAIPKSMTLWTGLGTALSTHDGQVSPAALFAFRQAARLVPDNPAPPFFLGLAYVRMGDFAAARPFWARALALTPHGMSYRTDIEVRLALLDRFLASQDAAQRDDAVR